MQRVQKSFWKSFLNILPWTFLYQIYPFMHIMFSTHNFSIAKTRYFCITAGAWANIRLSDNDKYLHVIASAFKRSKTDEEDIDESSHVQIALTWSRHKHTAKHLQLQSKLKEQIYQVNLGSVDLLIQPKKQRIQHTQWRATTLICQQESGQRKFSKEISKTIKRKWYLVLKQNLYDYRKLLCVVNLMQDTRCTNDIGMLNFYPSCMFTFSIK